MNEASGEEAIVTASLLHDIGHLILDERSENSDFLVTDLNHEVVGKRYGSLNMSRAVLHDHKVTKWNQYGPKRDAKF